MGGYTIKRYTDEQLEKNYETFIEAVKTSFSGERLEKLLHMYSMDELGPNLIVSPASGNKHYHNCYEGGYMDHILNVARNSLRVKKLYESIGGIIDFETEELLFAAFHHDLGKLGEKGKLYYIENDSKWHVENKGEFYKINYDDISYMTVTDKAIFLLAQYGVKYTENEYIGLRLADGMYEESNEQYLKTFNIKKSVRSNMPAILHWADHMSTHLENDIRRKETGEKF